MIRPVLLAAALSIPTAAHTQHAAHPASPSASPVASALRENAQRSQRILVAAAEDMPANKYGFKPTPAQMSFGQLVLHVAGANEFMCSSVTGATRPTEAKLTAESPKEALVARLKRSFEFCHSALAPLTDAALGDSVPFFGGRRVTRAAMILAMAGDWFDHYAAAAIYLRLNGILPPTARKPS